MFQWSSNNSNEAYSFVRELVLFAQSRDHGLVLFVDEAVQPDQEVRRYDGRYVETLRLELLLQNQSDLLHPPRVTVDDVSLADRILGDQRLDVRLGHVANIADWEARLGDGWHSSEIKREEGQRN